MGEQDLGESSWSDAVTDASQHVAERDQAKEEAASRQKPKAQAPKLAVGVLVLLGVLAWNVTVLTRPPDPIALPEVQASLVWFVADAVEVVEDFQVDEGRLPSQAEAADLLEDDVEYLPGGGGYAILIVSESTSVRYDSADDLEDWLARQLAAQPEDPR
jgi:hypothetical protein